MWTHVSLSRSAGCFTKTLKWNSLHEQVGRLEKSSLHRSIRNSVLYLSSNINHLNGFSKAEAENRGSGNICLVNERFDDPDCPRFTLGPRDVTLQDQGVEMVNR